jgi:hypothetical protein
LRRPAVLLLILFGGIGAVVVAGAIFGIAVLYFSGYSLTLADAPRVANTPNRAFTRNHTLVDESIAVAPGQVQWWSFELPRDARVYGRFHAAGGRNDIEAFLVDDDGLENLRNGHAARNFYHSAGFVTTDTIDCQLSAGKYNIVFSNAPSIVTNKIVDVKLEADY